MHDIGLIAIALTGIPERKHVNHTENLLRVRVLRGWVSDE